MASFDIKDLYTNIPLHESIEIVMNLIDPNIFNIPRMLFQKLLELSVYNTMFQFDGKYYRQIDGLGMGLPLSPTLANIFLCYHESDWLQNCPEDFKPVFFKRYMDDTFAIFREKNHVTNFLQYLNAKHVNITFTHEEEQNGKLPFLDCMVTRVQDQFTTSVYRKQTFSGLGLSFFSFSPIIYKLNSIKTLLFRANKISSTFTSLNKEISKLVTYFFENGYPKSLIYREIRKFIHKIQYPPSPIHTVDKQKIYVSFPYFGAQSSKLREEVIQLIGKIYPQIDFQMILVNSFSLGSMFSYKEKLPMVLKSSVIYKYSCARCASGTYVGSTTRAAYMRISEHRGRSFRTKKLLSVPSKSAIREHAFKCGPIRDENFSIIGQEKSDVHLRMLESIHIHRLHPTLNDMNSAFPLNIVR